MERSDLALEGPGSPWLLPPCLLALREDGRYAVSGRREIALTVPHVDDRIRLVAALVLVQRQVEGDDEAAPFEPAVDAELRVEGRADRREDPDFVPVNLERLCDEIAELLRDRAELRLVLVSETHRFRKADMRRLAPIRAMAPAGDLVFENPARVTCPGKEPEMS